MLHQFFAVFVAMLFSFGHHTTSLHSIAAAMANTSPAYSSEAAAPVLTFPGRADLAHGVAQAGYADSGCNTCQMTTVSFAAR